MFEVRPTQRLSLASLLALTAGFLFAPLAARALDSAPLRSQQAPYFSADVGVTLDTLSHSSVSVTLTVPYGELSWNRVAGGYAAGAGFSVELEPARRDRLYGGSWEKRLLIQSYDATHSSRNNLTVQRSFDVPPGRYRVRVRVRDVSSERESDAEDVLVVEDLARLPVGFADFQLGVVDSAGAFTPVPTRVFGYNSADLGARLVTFDRRPGPWPRNATLHWRTLDELGTPEQQGDTTVSLGQTTQSITLHASKSELFIGDYTLEIERVEGKSRWRTSRSLEVEESGPPHGREFTQMLEALGYVSPPEEVDALRNLPAEKQADAWERFWRRRDPTPDTPRNEFQIEFFRRLRYAAQHFQGFGAGWRSDMGRIYIRYGAPDQVEQHPASASTAAAEVWFVQPAVPPIRVRRSRRFRPVRTGPALVRMTAPTHAVVSLPALDLRRAPEHRGELASQLLMGETVRLLSAAPRRGWWRVRNDADGTRGGCGQWGLVLVSAARARNWRRLACGRISDPFVTRERTANGRPGREPALLRRQGDPRPAGSAAVAPSNCRTAAEAGCRPRRSVERARNLRP